MEKEVIRSWRIKCACRFPWDFKDDIIKPITFFPIFITDTTKDYNYIGDYLEENKDHICEYKKDDIFSPAQGDYYKRCYYFTQNFRVFNPL